MFQSFLICEARDRRRAEELMQSPLLPLKSCLSHNEKAVKQKDPRSPMSLPSFCPGLPALADS